MILIDMDTTTQHNLTVPSNFEHGLKSYIISGETVEMNYSDKLLKLNITRHQGSKP